MDLNQVSKNYCEKNVKDNELKEESSRKKDQEEEIKALKKKLEAMEAENACLKSSSVNQVEGFKVEDVFYTGPLIDGLPHGEGTWVKEWIGVFKGTWRNGKREGLHVGKNEYGGVYEYTYRDGRLNGFQQHTLSDGQHCEYYMKNGKYHGEYKKVLPDGDVTLEYYDEGCLIE